MSILIKRYANRKLYNTESSRYITLKGISALLDEGEEVKVVDNETGEDITKVALSQILVDSSRSNSAPSPSLLSQIMERGGDALYDVLKKGVGDASGNIDEIQDRFRKIIQGAEADEGKAAKEALHREPETEPQPSAKPKSERRGLGNWIAYASPDFDAAVENAVERVFKVLDLPRRKDVDALNQNMERVARAVESLEQALAAPPEDTALDTMQENPQGSEDESSDGGYR
ncbi:MAG: polyhydroxyalkanoate synthesis repressor PhaR [Myxococcota bacterium]|jgi:polyhydroxyalkanoate synthesis repressor PhaR